MTDEMTVTFKVPAERIAGVLVSAFGAGGIRYWGGLIEVVGALPEVPAGWRLGVESWCAVSGTTGGHHLVIHERDDARFIAEHKVTYEVLVAGLARLADTSPHVLGRILAGRADANDGDLYLQICIFGALKYG